MNMANAISFGGAMLVITIVLLGIFRLLRRIRWQRPGVFWGGAAATVMISPLITMAVTVALNLPDWVPAGASGYTFIAGFVGMVWADVDPPNDSKSNTNIQLG